MGITSAFSSFILGFIASVLRILTPTVLLFLFIMMLKYERDVTMIRECIGDVISFTAGAIIGSAVATVMGEELWSWMTSLGG